MKIKYVHEYYELNELDLLLTLNIVATKAGLNIHEYHIPKICVYLIPIFKDSRRNPEYYYLACIKRVLKDEQEQLKSIFNGCV